MIELIILVASSCGFPNSSTLAIWTYKVVIAAVLPKLFQSQYLHVMWRTEVLQCSKKASVDRNPVKHLGHQRSPASFPSLLAGPLVSSGSERLRPSQLIESSRSS